MPDYLPDSHQLMGEWSGTDVYYGPIPSRRRNLPRRGGQGVKVVVQHRPDQVPARGNFEDYHISPHCLRDEPSGVQIVKNIELSPCRRSHSIADACNSR